MAQNAADLKELQLDQYEWISLQQDIRNVQETQKEKLIRKFKENPFIPIGCLATTAALSFGLWSFKSGNRRMSQYMMRTRIAAQGFTVAALIVGIAMSASRAIK